MPLGGYLVSAAISTFDIGDLSFKDSPDVDDSEALTTPFLRGEKRGITKAFKFVSIQFHVVCVVHEYNLSRSVCRSFPSSADMISWYGCLFYCPGQCLQVDLRTAVNPAQHWALWHTWFQFRCCDLPLFTTTTCALYIHLPTFPVTARELSFVNVIPKSTLSEALAKLYIQITSTFPPFSSSSMM